MRRHPVPITHHRAPITEHPRSVTRSTMATALCQHPAPSTRSPIHPTACHGWCHDGARSVTDTRSTVCAGWSQWHPLCHPVTGRRRPLCHRETLCRAGWQTLCERWPGSGVGMTDQYPYYRQIIPAPPSTFTCHPPIVKTKAIFSHQTKKAPHRLRTVVRTSPSSLWVSHTLKQITYD